MLTDPDRKELERMLRVGESVAWPKVRECHRILLIIAYAPWLGQLHMIDNRLKVEVCLYHLICVETDHMLH